MRRSLGRAPGRTGVCCCPLVAIDYHRHPGSHARGEGSFHKYGRTLDDPDRRGPMVPGRHGKKGYSARALDGLGEDPLVSCAGATPSAGLHLGVVRDEALQSHDVLVVDDLALLRAKDADPAARRVEAASPGPSAGRPAAGAGGPAAGPWSAIGTAGGPATGAGGTAAGPWSAIGTAGGPWSAIGTAGRSRCIPRAWCWARRGLRRLSCGHE